MYANSSYNNCLVCIIIYFERTSNTFIVESDITEATTTVTPPPTTEPPERSDVSDALEDLSEVIRP